MSGKIGFFGVIALIALVGLSATSCREPEAAGRGIHGNLHRIEYNGNVAYVFGSMHLGRPEWFPLADVVEDAMRRADVFAFEFDLTQEELAVTISMEYIFLPGGQTLADFLPLDVYETFVAKMSTYYTFDYASMNVFTPMFISMLTAMELFGEMELDPAYSVDLYVMNFALENGLPIIGLNSLFSEISILYDLPDHVQIALAEISQDRSEALLAARDLRMVELYETQDLAGLLDLRLSMAEPDDAFSVHFLANAVHARCRIFAAEIERLLRQTPEPATFFVTMGILHIIGGEVDTNVLGLLRDAGFDVVPVF